jgi:hypothetical protein
MARDSEVEDFPVDVLDDEENVKRVEQEGLDAEEVAGPYVRRMKLQKCLPTQGRPRSWRAVRMYLATVLADTLNPNLASSACIRFWPQSRFSTAIRRMSTEVVGELHDGRSVASSVITRTNRGASHADATSTLFGALRRGDGDEQDHR